MLEVSRRRDSDYGECFAVAAFIICNPDRAKSVSVSTRTHSVCILPGITFSGGFVPGGLIERMKAMIFQRSSEVLMEKPIGGIGACTVPYWIRSKPCFSIPCEPNVMSLNSTSSVLPQNQAP